MPSLPRLRTDRLVLRRWHDHDREPFAALNADPEVMEHFPAAMTRAESDALVDRIEAGFEERGFGLWARSQAVMRRIGMTNDPADDFDHPLLDEGHPLRRHVLWRVSAASRLPG